MSDLHSWLPARIRSSLGERHESDLQASLTPNGAERAVSMVCALLQYCPQATPRTSPPTFVNGGRELDSFQTPEYTYMPRPHARLRSFDLNTPDRSPTCIQQHMSVRRLFHVRPSEL